MEDNGKNLSNFVFPTILHYQYITKVVPQIIPFLIFFFIQDKKELSATFIKRSDTARNISEALKSYTESYVSFQRFHKPHIISAGFLDTVVYELYLTLKL